MLLGGSYGIVRQLLVVPADELTVVTVCHVVVDVQHEVSVVHPLELGCSSWLGARKHRQPASGARLRLLGQRSLIFELGLLELGLFRNIHRAAESLLLVPREDLRLTLASRQLRIS